jgi:hypothetical protein
VPRWADNFLACCRALGYDVDAAASTVRGPAGVTSVRTYPIGVDVAQLRARTAQRTARDEARRVRALVGDRRMVLRVDRMEPAKNVLRGVCGFAELLAADPALHGRVLHYVLAYSSRSGLPDYRRYADEVHAAVRETNQRFGTDSWQPVVLDTENNFDRGLALMRRADVLVVNPLRLGGQHPHRAVPRWSRPVRQPTQMPHHVGAGVHDGDLGATRGDQQRPLAGAGPDVEPLPPRSDRRVSEQVLQHGPQPQPVPGLGHHPRVRGVGVGERVSHHATFRRSRPTGRCRPQCCRSAARCADRCGRGGHAAPRC